MHREIRNWGMDSELESNEQGENFKHVAYGHIAVPSITYSA